MHYGHETVDLFSPIRLKEIFRPTVDAWDEGRRLETLEKGGLIIQQIPGFRGSEKAETRFSVRMSEEEGEGASLSQAELACCKVGRVCLRPGLGIGPQDEIKRELLARQKMRPSRGRGVKKEIGIF
ncbi:hypothetical protein Dimus_037864 [Dionaea muscipula]